VSRRLVEGAALVVAVLAIFALRVVVSARSEWRAAAAASGELELMHLSRAARFYAPGNPYSRRALERLAAIGRSDEARALAAWTQVRSAILATRSFYTPQRALLDEANRELAMRLAQMEVASGRQTNLETARTWHAERLRQDYSPSLGWTLLALFGLATWVGSAVAFCLRTLDEQQRLRRRAAISWGLGIVAGLILFFLGLARA
jgi:hypothetical protein